MRDFESSINSAIKALIYCRVSSKSQLSGSGLGSQEHRCRQYADANNYEVVEVFTDDVTGGGDFMKRKGMVALLQYMDDYPDENFVVIFDDLKRYARDTQFHLALSHEMAKRGAIRECLNFKFDNTIEGEFVETVMSAHNTLERKQIARQSRQKTVARLEQGYWVHRYPVGYDYIKSKNGGHELVLNPIVAPIVKEGLEGFASGRFASQNELKLFFESQPDFPKNKYGKVYKQSIPKMLRKDLYAGLLHCDGYGVSKRKAKHEALISVETYTRIQERLSAGVYAPMRKDVHSDFPLRGGVSCHACQKPYTSGWCQGKRKKYAYYFCQTKGCEEYSKTIARDKMHEQFEAILRTLKPSEDILRVFAAMFKMRWEYQVTQAGKFAQQLKQQALEIEKQISETLDRIIEIKNPRVLSSFENRIENLENQKHRLEEKAMNSANLPASYDDVLKHCLQLVSNPSILWDSGRLDMRKLTLRLAFSGPLHYQKNMGFLNTNFSLPFKLLGKNFGSESMMVPHG